MRKILVIILSTFLTLSCAKKPIFKATNAGTIVSSPPNLTPYFETTKCLACWVGAYTGDIYCSPLMDIEKIREKVLEDYTNKRRTQVVCP